MRRPAIAIAVTLAVGAAGCTLSEGTQPICAQPEDAVMVLEAQSVPTATRLPCIAELPIGWRFGGMFVNDAGTRLDPFTGSRSLLFEGGCIVSRYRFASGSDPSLVIEADRVLSTLARSTVVAEVRRFNDLSLCGAEAPHCTG